jgi:hypothetical protein
LTSNPELAKKLFDEGAVIDTDGVGFGCTLIRREVLEKVSFRIDHDKPHSNGEYSHSDFYFALDCLECGFTSRVHLGCRCGHLSPMNEAGVYDPCIIFPVTNGEDGSWYRFLPLASVKGAGN